MLRIASANTATDANSHAIFQDANPPSVPRGTTISAQFLNDVQEGLAAVIEGVGIALSNAGAAGGADQLWNAINRLANAGFKKVTATGTTTLAASDAGRIQVDATAGNITLALPAAAAMVGAIKGTATAPSIQFEIIRTDTTANTVTIQRKSGTSDTIAFAGLSGTSFLLPGAATATIFSDAASVWLLTIPPPSRAAPRFQSYDTAGTYTFTVPAGVTSIVATVTASGGGGGGSRSTGDAGVAGAGGPRVKLNLPVSPGDVLTVVVGAGGTAGAGGASPTAGGQGGTTSITDTTTTTTLVSITGGQGGAASNNAGVVSTANSPGVVTTSLPYAGEAAAGGGFAVQVGTNTFINAQGGTPGGVGLPPHVGGAGATPTLPGAGGEGGTNNAAGGAGAPGRVLLEY